MRCIRCGGDNGIILDFVYDKGLMADVVLCKQCEEEIGHKPFEFWNNRHTAAHRGQKEEFCKKYNIFVWVQ